MKLLLAALLLTATLASAQSIVPRTIVFEGAPQFPTADLLKLSGLHTGTKLTQPDIEAAMNRLADSGLFTGVDFKTSGDTLTFTLEPSARAQTQRVAYTNFVWYTPDALNAAVHTRVPLFTGTVPPASPLAEQVRLALVAILKDERGLNATVTATPVSGGRLDYTVTTPRVLVGELHIANVDFDSDPGLAAVRNSLGGSDYLDGITQKAVTGNVGDALEELGYLDQSLSPVTLGQPRTLPDKARVVVDLNATATPGPLYKVARVDFPKPLPTITPRDYQSEFDVRAGGRPSPSLVRNTTFALEHAYSKHGFLDAKAAVTPAKNTAAHTMSYTYTVVPGDLYRMRSLVFAVGVDARQQSILTQAWRLPKGDRYDETIAEAGLQTDTAKKVCGNAEIKMNLIPDPATHEVDVNLSCGRQLSH